MFHNGVECLLGIIVNQEVVQALEVQSLKKYQDTESLLPGKELVMPHVAEALRQAEGAQVATMDRWAEVLDLAVWYPVLNSRQDLFSILHSL